MLQQDLAAAHREQLELSQQLETARAEFASDKKMLEATITDLSTVEDRALSTQASVQEDLRRQSQIAKVCLMTLAVEHCIHTLIIIRTLMRNILVSLSLMLRL